MQIGQCWLDSQAKQLMQLMQFMQREQLKRQGAYERHSMSDSECACLHLREATTGLSANGASANGASTNGASTNGALPNYQAVKLIRDELSDKLSVEPSVDGIHSQRLIRVGLCG